MKKFKTKFTQHTQVRTLSTIDGLLLGTNGNVVTEPIDNKESVGVNIKGVLYQIPQDMLQTEKEYIIEIQTNQLLVWKQVLTATAYEKLVEYSTKDNKILHASNIIRGNDLYVFIINYARSICK
jgi:cation transport regulator ChaC